MSKTKITLVLGAGASCHCGFPLGYELKRDILSMQDGRNFLAISCGIQRHPLFLEFVAAFAKSHLDSIDDFLGKNMRYAEIGRMTIAAILMNYENTRADSLRDGNNQSWYGHLWNHLAAGNSLEELNFGKLAIVTFNYDRSLEAFLLRAIEGSYGLSEEKAAEKLEELNIVHVYGDIGELSRGDRYRPYGSPVTDELVLKASKWLKVIPEARDDDPAFVIARERLTGADSICFLGFGFDRLNLKRLDSANTCMTQSRTATSVRLRKIAASCLGRTPAEARASAEACGVMFQPISSESFPQNFIDGDCLRTLRETLILGQ